jgi:hypothetical protein
MQEMTIRSSQELVLEIANQRDTLAELISELQIADAGGGQPRMDAASPAWLDAYTRLIEGRRS